MSERLTVHLRVVDGVTKQPTPVSLCVGDMKGNWFAPQGRFVEFPVGRGESVGGQVRDSDRRLFFYIDGACEIVLPSGVSLRLSIRKGPAYLPLETTVALKQGQLTLRYEIQPVVGFDASRWIAGDARVQFVDPHSAILEAMAEGVSVVQLLATVLDTPSQDGTVYRSVPNLASFSGTESCLANEFATVAVNTLNTHPALGRVGLLHSHRPVFPLSFGDMDETDDWSICDWCDQCHRKTGLVTWCDPFDERRGILGGESLIAAILWKIDAFEISPESVSRSGFAWYYRLLNAGVRIPLIGASGKQSNRNRIGEIRTWVRRSTGALVQNWIDRVRGGESSISTGLPVTLTSGEHPPGSIYQSFGGNESVRVQSKHFFAGKVRHELIANGKVVAEFQRGEAEARLPEGGWLCARVVAEGGGFGHSSPLYVEWKNRRGFPESVRPFLDQIESTREWVRTVGRFNLPKSRDHLLSLADQAEAVLRQRLDGQGG